MSKFISRCLSALLFAMLAASAGTAFGFTAPVKIGETLQGCRNNGTITFPISGPFICPDAAYTTGNLGKGWNELDLVPFRLTTSAGASGASTTYNIYIAADYQQGTLGYDVISVPVVNSAKSAASCSVSAGSQTIVTGVTGGTDVTAYRLLTITQAANTTCVFDWYQRLALGAAQFSGSNLQAYIFDQVGLSGGKRTVPIPVNQILPQSLSKDMSATADSTVQWNLTKEADKTSLDFGDVCAANAPTSKVVTFTVKWIKVGTTAGGVTVITNIYAKNPAARTITVNVTDKIYKGTTQSELLDTANSGAVDVTANNTQLVLTHTVTLPSSAGNVGDYLNDVATATYIDKVNQIPVPGTTSATATAQIGQGVTTDASAAIADVESISGTALKYSVAQPSLGAFQPYPTPSDLAYAANTQTAGTVAWGLAGQTSSGQVDFVKTVYLLSKTLTTGTLTDTATLVTTDTKFTKIVGPIDVSISSSATVKLTISKTIPPILGTGETIKVKFTVTRSGDLNFSQEQTISFASGETTKSVDVTGPLVPDTYTVTENSATFFAVGDLVGVPSGLQPVGGNQQSKNLTAGGDGIFQPEECAGTISFTNAVPSAPASAQVQKITYPAIADDPNDPNYADINWTFTLTGPGYPNGVTKTVKAGAGFGAFQATLQEGTYYVTETTKTGWTLNSAAPEGAVTDKVCEFTVNFPQDIGNAFSCTFTNTKQGKAKVVKTVLGSPPSGTQAFTFQLRSGASLSSDGTVLESLVANANNGGLLSFSTLLVPGDTYQLCEVVAAGWTTTLGTFVPNSFNPNADNSVLCGNFTVVAGGTKTFTVDNSPPPGGRALTIGYWKNWASCKKSGGHQAPVLDQTMAKAEPTGIQVDSFYLHGSTATPNVAPDCAKAVSLLSKQNYSGKNMASDPLFNMTAQLVAAELNLTAGAYTCPQVAQAVFDANALLTKYGFTGTGYTGPLSATDATAANNLAKLLDDYNNDRPAACQ